MEGRAGSGTGAGAGAGRDSASSVVVVVAEEVSGFGADEEARGIGVEGDAREDGPAEEEDVDVIVQAQREVRAVVCL